MAGKIDVIWQELLKACLTNIPIYLMSLIRFPKWAIEIINSHMAKFF
jgi:hypothetical protein